MDEEEVWEGIVLCVLTHKPPPRTTSSSVVVRPQDDVATHNNKTQDVVAWHILSSSIQRTALDKKLQMCYNVESSKERG